MSEPYSPGTITTSRIKEYTVVCNCCKKESTVAHYNMRDAVAEFRRDGWCVRALQWHCGDCAIKKDNG